MFQTTNQMMVGSWRTHVQIPSESRLFKLHVIRHGSSQGSCSAMYWQGPCGEQSARAVLKVVAQPVSAFLLHNGAQEKHSSTAQQHTNAKTAALTAHWCVEASVFTDGLMGHGVYRPSSSFTIEVPDSSSPLISLSCQYSSKVMSHSWLSWFTTRLLILMVDISIGGWGSGPTQKWGGHHLVLMWGLSIVFTSAPGKKKLIVSSTKKPSLILTLTAFGSALIAIQFNSYLFPTHPKADLLDHELGWLWMIPPTHISIIYGPRYIQITSELCFITLGS